VGGDRTTRTELRGEVGLHHIIHLLNARSAKVDAAELGGVLAAGNGGDDLVEFGESQGTGGRLNGGKGLGDAELVALRCTTNPVKRSAVYRGMVTHSARQAAFLAVG